MLRKKNVYAIALLGIIIIVLVINLIVAYFFPSFVELTLSLLIASVISTFVQIISALRSMAELEIRYISNKSDDLYELYHHKDVPLNDILSGERSNHLLIGLANAGKSIARNCYAILWIYSNTDFSKPLDNPSPLYWMHDPNSRPPNIRLPEYHNIAPKDERFLGICYSVKSSNKFYFDDYEQHVSTRRQMICTQIFKEPVLYIKVVAYCDNGDPTQKFFSIDKKNYDSLTMKEITPS